MTTRLSPLSTIGVFAVLWVAAPFASAADVHHEAESIPVTHEKSATATEPKPLAISAGGVSLQFGGFVKFDAMHDFDPIGNQDQFKVNSIPVAGEEPADYDSSHMTVKATRLSLDIRNATAPGNGLRAYFEGDFYGSDDNFRIRHAYGEWLGFLAGQTWSTFQDISARPFTLDYEGPDAEIFVRQPLVRYTRRTSDVFQWSIGAEEADSQVSSSVDGSGDNDIPDLTGALRFSNAKGHVQVGGLLRQLGFASSDGLVDETTNGYGLNLTGKAKVLDHDSVMGQFAFGKGMGRYIESFGGTDSDAYLTSTGDLEAIDSWAAVLGYSRTWTEKWHSTIAAAMAELDNIGQADDSIKSARSAHLNLVYNPFPQFMVGGELMWGERENFDGNAGDATRFQLTAQYKFR